MTEKGTILSEVFPGLAPDKSRILAQNIFVIETTLGDSMACRICLHSTPIGLRRIMPAQTIRSIHNFIIENKGGDSRVPLNYHWSGQPSDYYDEKEDWDMASVVVDGLRTKRPLSLFFHGIDGADLRALNAIKKIQSLGELEKQTIHVVISTDPFGPCNVPLDDAEEIGRQRTANALLAFQGMPNMELRILFAEKFRSKEEESKIARKRFNGLLPPNVFLIPLVQPTRSPLPVDKKIFFDSNQGYIITTTGNVFYSRSSGFSRGEKIGTLSNIPNQAIRERENFAV